MAADDERYYVTFYGVELTDWPVTFGSFSNHTKLLVTDYESEAANTVDYSNATDTNEFLFQDHLKRIYFIEGVATGQVTFAASGCTATIEAYRVSIGRVNEQTNQKDILYTTGWITTSYTLDWDSTYSVGDEVVFPFRINCWDHEELGEYDRIFVRVETDTSTCTDSSCSCMALWHSNDANYEDFKIEIPFRL